MEDKLGKHVWGITFRGNFPWTTASSMFSITAPNAWQDLLDFWNGNIDKLTIVTKAKDNQLKDIFGNKLEDGPGKNIFGDIILESSIVKNLPGQRRKRLQADIKFHSNDYFYVLEKRQTFFIYSSIEDFLSAVQDVLFSLIDHIEIEQRPEDWMKPF